jgi:hypothetical protein
VIRYTRLKIRFVTSHECAVVSVVSCEATSTSYCYTWYNQVVYLEAPIPPDDSPSKSRQRKVGEDTEGDGSDHQVEAEAAGQRELWGLFVFKFESSSCTEEMRESGDDDDILLINSLTAIKK